MESPPAATAANGPLPPTPNLRACAEEALEWARGPTEPASVTLGPPPPVRRGRTWGSRWSERITSPEGFSWILATLISAAVAAGLSYVVNSAPIPPGGDPGTWISTGYAYLGGSHPSQVIPLAYPPVLFPMLGVLVLLTGSPITAGQVFVPILYFTLGLSIFYLAGTMLRSRLVALAVMTFLLIDPQLLQMVFWGAYPNLLAFVFMNFAIAGLVWMGRGAIAKGSLMFWVFGALTILTHSLAAIVLAGSVGVFLLLSWAVAVPTRDQVAAQYRDGLVDVPAVIRRGLFFSRGGKAGLLVFSAVVGAYYALTAFAKVPHPNYFVSNALAFRVIGLGGVFHAVFPGINLVSLFAVYLLVLFVMGLLFWYAVALMYRPAWLTTPVLLLIAIGVTVCVTPVAGWILRIVTDYTRFGFFLLIPTGLSIAYLIDRGWMSARHHARPRPPPPGAGVRESLAQHWLRGSPHPRRAVALSVTMFVVALMVAGGITQPSMWRSEAAFTEVGHNQNFLEALNAIQKTGLPGAILTVPGADKWARAITERNTYAPYTQAAYLFYQSQVLDSDLSLYALTSRYAITNGIVSAYAKGVAPVSANGTPTYGAYVVGAFRPVLSAPTNYMSVQLMGEANRTLFSVPVTVAPQIQLINQSNPEITLTYLEPTLFDLTEIISVLGSSPGVSMTYTLYAGSGNFVESLNFSLVPASYTTAIVAPGSIPGEFFWDTQTRYVGPLTFGNVTPISALRGVTPLNPASATPAVILSFPTGVAGNASSLTGSIALTTPAASTLFNVLPPVIDTLQVWSSLDVEFILMRNPTYAASPEVAFPGEVQYLIGEFGAIPIYSNVEWTVLELPG